LWYEEKKSKGRRNGIGKRISRTVRRSGKLKLNPFLAKLNTTATSSAFPYEAFSKIRRNGVLFVLFTISKNGQLT
jgi:hypothetical protein